MWAVAVVVVLLLAGVLTACDAEYEFVIENNLERPVEVVFGETIKYHMRPCSVLVDYQVREPVKRLTAHAEDLGGNLVYTAEFTDLGSGPHPWRVHVELPSERPSECPAPATEELILTVENARAEEC